MGDFDYVSTARAPGTAAPRPGFLPDWRAPPGVKPLRVALGVAFWLGVAAIPVFFVPMLNGPQSAAEKRHSEHYAVAKQKAREERMRWVQSDDMPRK